MADSQLWLCRIDSTSAGSGMMSGGMQLNLKTDYSLRLLLYLVAHASETVPVGRIADDFGVSAHHLAKVAQALTKLGVVRQVRGRAGGLRLAVAPESLRLGELIRRMEGSLALVECFDAQTNTCVIAPVCGLKGVLNLAQRAFMEVLDRYTLADVTRKTDALRRILRKRD
jgi:Rrf2 family nitric oxide-sensitive transcriptional repressor